MLWRRAAGSLGRTALWLGAIGAAYSVFTIVGVGKEAFGWALVLAAAGLPFYGLRLLRNRAAPAAG